MSAAAGAGSGLPACFRGYRGAVLVLSAEGVVLDSNGCLERELGARVVGRVFAELLDAGSSAAKWARMLAGAEAADASRGAVWELVLAGTETLAEPRSFSVLPAEAGRALWLLEHPADPRLDALREAVTGVNSELANTQRELVKERGRLARALEELEARNRETQRLSQRVQEQNRELERSNAALDEFAHVVAHDLKAPLRSIGFYAQWIAEDDASRLSDESREHLARLASRVGRLKAMVDGILHYARAGRERAPPERVSLDELLRDLLELLDPPASVMLRIEPRLPTLFTERAPLQQVLLNLLGNALRYAARSAQPQVRVGAGERGGFVEFRVADNGPGIAPALQGRIWGLFQTLEPEETAEGTGLGLAVVKKLVEARGGRVWVESSLGAGAAFHFLWPQDARAASP